MPKHEMREDWSRGLVSIAPFFLRVREKFCTVRDGAIQIHDYFLSRDRSNSAHISLTQMVVNSAAANAESHISKPQLVCTSAHRLAMTHASQLTQSSVTLTSEYWMTPQPLRKQNSRDRFAPVTET